MTELLLHVGMPRSGAVLRPALERLRPQLRAHGVAYVGGEQLERLRHVAGWHRDPWHRPQDAAPFARELGALVAAESRRAAGRAGLRTVRVVLSADALLGSGAIGLADADRFRPYAEQALGQVVAALSPSITRVALYTHRQDRLMELAQLERIRAGREDSFEDVFPNRFAPVLDYGALVERLHAVAGIGEVHVRPVELADAGTYAFVNDFLGLLGLADTLDLFAIGTGVYPHPPVYTERGARLALAMNPLLSTARELDLVREFLSTRYLAGEEGTADLLERGSRERILECYGASNEALFRRYAPDLPADSYADDARTFDLGNVLRQPVPPVPSAAAAARASAAETAIRAKRRARRTAGRALRWSAQRLPRR
jgi:hypothetical protein